VKTRIYAIGDVHGRLDLLEQLYDRIIDHATTSDVERRVLVHLGDYVDRGPDSKGVLLRVRAGLPSFEMILLKGNHEELMLEFLEEGNGDALERWLDNGGVETLRSFGIDPDREAVDREEAIAAIGPELLRWLCTLTRSHREGDLFFAHAGVRPGVPLAQQDPEDLIWIRRDFTNSEADFGARVVHGHSPSPEPVIRANRIGIDTGAVWTGHLTAAVLDPELPQAEPLILMTDGPDLAEITEARRRA
jgi:serine/threonine protein phosphatase 1